MIKAKSSADVTYIAQAESTGHVEIRPESVATRIKVNSEGKAKSVIYIDRNGLEHEQDAEIIIVSTGAIQSPRLLLNSKSSLFPEGLANSSGLVGKYYMIHPYVKASYYF
jgi:choline dehydrogenase-like flavoprotein